MFKLVSKLVPKILSVEQKANRLEICQDLLGRLEIETDLLDKVITGDESWVFDYDPKTKRQSAEWHMKISPRPKKARMSRCSVKTRGFLTTVALGRKNLHLQDRQLITPSTKMSCNDFENGSSESTWTLQTIGCCTTIMHQLNTELSFREFLAMKNIPVLPHPTYSPDLALCYFYLFPKLKLKLKFIISGRWKAYKKTVTDEIHTLMENEFRYCYDQWKKRWNHCVTSQESYFEGDNL
jgi:histone-lysine N-methyltransferase SETMAR